MLLQILSLVGSVSLLVGYALLVFGYINNKSSLFYFLNAAGCFLITISLWYGLMNWGSFLLQLVFGAISIYGIFKNLK